jgi:hypothetical protein
MVISTEDVYPWHSLKSARNIHSSQILTDFHHFPHQIRHKKYGIDSPSQRECTSTPYLRPCVIAPPGPSRDTTPSIRRHSAAEAASGLPGSKHGKKIPGARAFAGGNCRGDRKSDGICRSGESGGWSRGGWNGWVIFRAISLEVWS